MQIPADNRRRVLVFGATGFLGSHLCRHLAGAGWTVGAVTRMDATRRPTLPDAHALMDLKEGALPLLKSFAPHAVVNAAVCYGRAGESLSEMVRVNTHLPLEIAEAADLAGCPRFVHIDTFSWKPRTGAFMDNSYTRTKRLAGELLAAMSPTKMAIALARLEFPYGPNDRPHKLVPTLLSAFARGQPHFDLSDATQRRDFVWIDDVVLAIERMVACELSRGFTEIEVGTGQAIPVREFVETLRQACGGSTELRFGARPRLAGEMELSVADTSWMRRIGVAAEVDVAEGCRRLAAASGLGKQQPNPSGS